MSNNTQWDLKAFFKEVVEPDCRDYFYESLNKRMAIHCCLSLNHTLDWFVHERSGTSIKDFQNQYKKDFPVIWIIRDICNAYKHYEITRYTPATANRDPIDKKKLMLPISMYQGNDIISCKMGQDYSELIIKLSDNNAQVILLKNVIIKVEQFWSEVIKNETALKKAMKLTSDYYQDYRECICIS